MQRALAVALLLVLTAGPAVAPAVWSPVSGLAADGPALQQPGGAGDCTFPVTRTDATGTAVTVRSTPERVVALQPSAAQTMWEIGGRSSVVGMPVNQYTSDLEGYREPANVVAADGYTVDVEAVVNLTPDLVLSPNVTPPGTVSTLRDAGVTVYHFRAAGSIDDVYSKTRLTGRLTGHCAGADDRVAWMRERIDRVRRAVDGEPRPTVIYPLGGGVVAGSGTFLHELVTVAGGRNLAAEAGVEGYRQLSAEVIVARDPEWLVLNEGLPRSAVQMDAYNRTTAVREDQVVRVNPNYANQPAPRIVYPIEAIARALHPTAMAESTAPTTTTQSPGPPSLTPTDPGPTATPAGTRSPGQPGLGVGVGLAAIAIALLAAARRPR